MLRRFDLTLCHIRINSCDLMLNKFAGFGTVIGFDIRCNHYLNTRCKQLRKNFGGCCAWIFSYVNCLCISVVEHEIIFLEIEIIGSAVQLVNALCKILFGKLRYGHIVCTHKEILQHFHTLL